nr:uncharacterized mitochondrial protein AtMg00810-like [Tanacetum cinerariifolium]
FLGTIRFGNNDFAVITGYGDVVIGSMTIKKVYYVEGLGHNLFSVGNFCNKGLEVAFRRSTSFVRNKDGVDLLTGDRLLNLCTIALNEVASNSLTCLLAKASSTQSWLWHQRLSHLNVTTINNLVNNNLVQGLPKMKFEKDHLCSACEQGKIHRKQHKSKMAFASNKPLYLLHIDLCGPIRVESINGKRYVLVVVDDYSRYTWVFFLHSKDEASEVIISFIKKTQLNLQLQVQRVRTDNAPYELMNKRKPNIKFFRVFGCRCYILNDYEDVGKLKAKEDIRVFVGYSKEYAAFRIYNKQSRKIHESVNVNVDEISKMASKQFSLEPGLSNLNKTGKSSNPSVSQVSETSKKDLKDLFHNIYDEYFDSSKIMKSSITNVETSINEEVFHETAFLNGILREEVYVGQPLGFVSKQYLDHVFRMENRDTVPTRMVEQAKLKLDFVGNPIDHTDYRSMIGSLMYVTSSRPDIMFTTCMCARYQENPNEHHVSTVKRIFRYLEGTINLSLWYPKDSGFDLTAYSDADHVGCHLDRKSTSGSVQFLGDKLVCWLSKKQNCVSISIAESEYVAVSSCCA